MAEPSSTIAVGAVVGIPAVFALLGDADPLVGGSGWAGCGILGLVLAWLLLKHLPDQAVRFDKLIREFADREDRARVAYETALKAVIDHCERENIRITKMEKP